MKRYWLVRVLIAADTNLTHLERRAAAWLAGKVADAVVAVLDPPSSWPRNTGAHVQDVLRPATDEWTEEPPEAGRDEDDDLESVLGAAVTPSDLAAAPAATRPTPAPPAPPITKPHAVVQARCLYCGDVTVPAPDVEVVIFRNALHLSWYGITCPACRRRTIRSAAAEDTRAALLTATGARIDIELVPAEALEERPYVGPLTADDILDAHLWLDVTDDLAAAAGVVDLTDGGTR